MIKIPVGQPFIGEQEIANVVQTLREGRLTQGGVVQQFESLLATTLNVKHVVACSSGTAALHLALVAAGIGPGDEVLVPDLSYVSTANAVSYTGATPVLIDVDAATWNISLTDAARKVSSKTKAIMPVHLYGVPCNMDAVRTFAQAHVIDVIEDAAEGLGGQHDGAALGTHGLCGTFSFYANKIITTGEGGAVVTDDDDLANTLRYLRGQAVSPERRFWHAEVGFNYRMTDVAAAIGLAQLGRLPEFLAQRHRVVQGYRNALGGVVATPDVPGTAPWLFTGILPEGVSYGRAERVLAEAGIEVRPVFIPMHDLPMYARPAAQFPNATYIAKNGISLPTHPSMTPEDVQFISQTLVGLL